MDKKVTLMLDTNVVVNLYWVHQDFPDILEKLIKTSRDAGIELLTTNVVIQEIDPNKYPEEASFIEELLTNVVRVVDVSEKDVDEFRRRSGLFSMGKGEVSAIAAIKMLLDINPNTIFILLTADNRHVLKKRERILRILGDPKNLVITHALLLYYIIHRLGIYNEQEFYKLLFSSNRDLRISRKDLDSYLPEFETIYRELFA